MALAEKLTGDLKPSYLQGEVTRLNNAINALGPVNMAALDELAAARERKTFLDAQSADLNDAINTLEDAIAKIDQETRALLQGTFDQRQPSLRRAVPAACSVAAQARLIMTGEEILDAGVQVMAQPPGKKNSTIHLLSGGEKALTAIALVFAMFQLNPAPFCLLDEVDAPLDDANTERYANMVAHMSDKTQFVFSFSQQDSDGDGPPADRRDHAGARRIADRGGGYGCSSVYGGGRFEMELQNALIIAGVILLLLLVAYNRWQIHKGAACGR